MIEFQHARQDAEPFWDYGWFDVATFLVSDHGDLSPAEVLNAFTRSSMFARSYCTSPDPWGNGGERHGPFLIEHFNSEWYVKIPVKTLGALIHATIDGHDLKPTLSDAQWAKIDSFGDRRKTDSVWHLQPPDDESVRVDWDYIWWAFDQFVVFDSLKHELSVGVIGYD